MEVFFTKIYDRNSELFRFVPIIKDMDELEEQAIADIIDNGFAGEEPCFDNVDMDKLWVKFLSHYNLVVIEDNDLDEELRIYRLKNDCKDDFPPVVATAWAAPNSGIRLKEGTEHVLSYPHNGRYREYVVFDGEMSFNGGSFFQPNWMVYTIDSIHGNFY